jgi:hypothetical protein
MGDALTRREPTHLALTVLPNFAAALAKDFFFLENRFASFQQGVASGSIGT